MNVLVVNCGSSSLKFQLINSDTEAVAAAREMAGQVIYPAAVLNITKNEEAAKAFLAYLQGEEASAVFEAVGFSPLA